MITAALKFVLGSALAITFIAACKVPVTTTSPSGASLTDSVLVKTDRWRADSAGCFHYRSLALAKEIVFVLPEEYRNFDSLLVLLGPPDARVENKSFLSLSYLHHSICSASQDTPDTQWISFDFDPHTRKFIRVGQGGS
jgi:hypothetical protein